MTNITRIDTNSRMSQAVIYNNIIWLAGQVGEPGASVKDQTRQMLKNVDRLLEENGSKKSNILQVTIWLADMEDFNEMNLIYDAWVDKDNLPTRAASEAKLATPEYKVEIIVVAALN